MQHYHDLKGPKKLRNQALEGLRKSEVEVLAAVYRMALEDEDLSKAKRGTLLKHLSGLGLEASTLRELGGHLGDCLPSLVEQLGHKDGGMVASLKAIVRGIDPKLLPENALIEAGRFFRDGKFSLEGIESSAGYALAALLGSGDYKKLRATLEKLKLCGAAARPARTSLEALCNDNNTKVRGAAWEMLLTIEEDPVDLGRLAQRCLDDRAVGSWAFEALPRLSPADAERLLRKGLRKGSQTAAKLVVSLRDRAAVLIPDLVRMVEATQKEHPRIFAQLALRDACRHEACLWALTALAQNHAETVSMTLDSLSRRAEKAKTDLAGEGLVSVSESRRSEYEEFAAIGQLLGEARASIRKGLQIPGGCPLAGPVVQEARRLGGSLRMESWNPEAPRQADPGDWCWLGEGDPLPLPEIPAAVGFFAGHIHWNNGSFRGPKGRRIELFGGASENYHSRRNGTRRAMLVIGIDDQQYLYFLDLFDKSPDPAVYTSDHEEIDPHRCHDRLSRFLRDLRP